MANFALRCFIEGGPDAIPQRPSARRRAGQAGRRRPDAVSVRFIFETDTTQRWYDADGAGAAVLVADLQAGATMAAANIKIV